MRVAAWTRISDAQKPSDNAAQNTMIFLEVVIFASLHLRHFTICCCSIPFGYNEKGSVTYEQTRLDPINLLPFSAESE